MELTVVELFAGVGGFRVGLNDIKSFDEMIKQSKIEIGNSFGRISLNHLQKHNLHITAIAQDLAKSILPIQIFKKK